MYRIIFPLPYQQATLPHPLSLREGAGGGARDRAGQENSSGLCTSQVSLTLNLLAKNRLGVCKTPILLLQNRASCGFYKTCRYFPSHGCAMTAPSKRGERAPVALWCEPTEPAGETQPPSMRAATCQWHVAQRPTEAAAETAKPPFEKLNISKKLPRPSSDGRGSSPYHSKIRLPPLKCPTAPGRHPSFSG